MDHGEIEIIGNDVVPQPVLIYGRPDCEDTAYVRDQLNEFHVPFVEINIDADEAASKYVTTINHGMRITPTIVFGDEDFIVVQPTHNELFQALRRAGYGV